MIRKKDVSTIRLVVSDIAGPIRVGTSEHAVIAVAVAVEVQLKVSCGFRILEYSLCCGHMTGE